MQGRWREKNGRKEGRKRGKKKGRRKEEGVRWKLEQQSDPAAPLRCDDN
jgi:hypothetical protein